jgi:O-antigen/teichoic acid export membrane protein
MAIVFVVTGGRLITLLYGEKYASASVFIGWLSVMWALRTVRVAPTLAAIARGDTRNAMVSNLARSSALLGMIVLAAAGRNMVWIAISGFVGEFLALVVCVWRLQLRHDVPAAACFRPYGAFSIGIGIAAIVAARGATKLGLTGNVLVACALAAMQIVAMAYLFGTVRGEVRELLFRLQSTITGTKAAFDPDL